MNIIFKKLGNNTGQKSKYYDNLQMVDSIFLETAS